MFSKACEYGIRAAIYIAEQSLMQRKVGLKEVANSIASPEAFTSKILQALCKGQILQSEKGPKGGFSMGVTQINSVKLSDVVLAIDGDSIYKGCGLGLKQCNGNKPCPLHFQFKKVRDELQYMLEGTTITELAMDKSLRKSYLKL